MAAIHDPFEALLDQQASLGAYGARLLNEARSAIAQVEGIGAAN